MGLAMAQVLTTQYLPQLNFCCTVFPEFSLDAVRMLSKWSHYIESITSVLMDAGGWHLLEPLVWEPEMTLCDA